MGQRFQERSLLEDKTNTWMLNSIIQEQNENQKITVDKWLSNGYRKQAI